MDIGQGITFGGGVNVTKQPAAYLMGTLASGFNEIATIIRVDSSGNFYVGGYPIAGISANYALLAKYNSSGILQWKKQLTGEGDYPRIYSMDIDSSGNIYIGGTYNPGGTTLGLISLINSSGAFVWSVNFQGTASGKWTPSVAGPTGASISSVAVSSSGVPYFTGNAGYPFIVAWPGGSSTPTLLKLLYATQGYSSSGKSIKLDSSGNIYLTGLVTISSNTQMFVAKFNSSGAVQWQKTLSSSGTDTGYGVDVDSSGNVYITGVSDGNGNDDIITAKYNSSGVIQWQKRLSSGVIDQSTGIAVDSSGNVYITGRSNTGSTNDLIIVKYNTSGVLQWQNKIVGASGGDEGGTSITTVTNSDGTILYISGYVTGASNDMFLAKLPSDGTGLGTFTIGSVTVTYATSTLTDVTSTLTDASSDGTVTSYTYGMDDRSGATTNATSTTSTIVTFYQ